MNIATPVVVCTLEPKRFVSSAIGFESHRPVRGQESFSLTFIWYIDLPQWNKTVLENVTNAHLMPASLNPASVMWGFIFSYSTDPALLKTTAVHYKTAHTTVTDMHLTGIKHHCFFLLICKWLSWRQLSHGKEGRKMMPFTSGNFLPTACRTCARCYLNACVSRKFGHARILGGPNWQS
jgi:hypothetical protein